MAVTSRLEDYLEALFHLETTGGRQTVTALAENLKLTKGTIATVIKKMAEQQLVLHEAYGAIRLTPKGREIGWRVFMKHERLTVFFRDLLGVDAEKSEEIACLIEHHLDGSAANRFFNLVHFLQGAQANRKDWTKDLFRELSQAGNMPAPLTVGVFDKGRVCRLTGDAKTVENLNALGIAWGDTLENVTRCADGGHYEATVNARHVVKLDEQTAATVWIV